MAFGFGRRKGPEFPPIEVPGDGELRAVLRTSRGDIVLRLFEQRAPRTVANFVGLATGRIEWIDPSTGETLSRPLYEGSIFHRVIPNFMIQGGAPPGRSSGGPGYRFDDEFDPALRHSRPGILSMANSGPNTNGSQFFVTEVAAPFFDQKHSVFGDVVAGMDVVKTIARVPANPGNSRPYEDVVIRSVTVYRGESSPA
jgi:peptidyl-prolyl cis-trans isomerase A (cyclophilin A)